MPRKKKSPPATPKPRVERPTEAPLAVIATGGKQYIVRPGMEIKVQKIEGDKKSIDFEDLLAGKKVKATITGVAKSAKIQVRKFKSKVRYLRNKGHRQVLSTLRIEKIS